MVKIAIATNKKYFINTLPILINSLISCGIEKEDIFVFNSGYDEEFSDIIEGIKYFFLAQNSYEYSPLISIVEKELKSEYWFLLHDTCKVGLNFKKLLYNIPSDKPDKLALKTKPAMSIGAYKYDYLIANKDKLLKIKNMDYSASEMRRWKLWGVPNEDYILWMTEPEPIIYNNINEWSIVGYENWYGSGTIRRTEYYPSLDLYKNKANWGQTGNNMVTDV